jgi:hypothetical protein
MLRRTLRRWAMAGSMVLACGATPAHWARGESITWDRASPFQACLAAGLDKWLETQVAVLTNDDPASWKMDDVLVAEWTVETLASCKTRAGSVDEAAETRFTKYMAQWRQHVQALVESVRERGKPD